MIQLADMRGADSTPKQHEDLAPIWVRLRPVSSTLEDWRKIVDQHLKVRAALDMTRLLPGAGHP